VLAGLAMFALGWIGVALGRLIQAAISRQREFLADASAVQFTRDTTGLRNALVKIAAEGGGSRLDAHGTAEVAHMLFASGLDEMFATHPPLEERIRALDPGFDREEIVREGVQLAAAARAARDAKIAPPTAATPLAGLSRLVANPRLEHLRFAGQLRDALPVGLLADAGDPQRAVECLWALVLSSDEGARARELEVLTGAHPPETMARIRQRRDALAPLDASLRMPLLLRLFPALGRRPIPERQALLALLDRVVAADGTITLSEYAFARLARIHLFEQTTPPGPVPRLAASALEPDLAVVLSVLARAGATDPQAAAASYDLGMRRVLEAPRTPYAPPADWVPAMDAALARVDQMRLNDKPRLVDALAAVVANDARVDVPEAELLRAICGIVHCPLPPLLFAPDAAPVPAAR